MALAWLTHFLRLRRLLAESRQARDECTKSGINGFIRLLPRSRPDPVASAIVCKAFSVARDFWQTCQIRNVVDRCVYFSSDAGTMHFLNSELLMLPYLRVISRGFRRSSSNEMVIPLGLEHAIAETFVIVFFVIVRAGSWRHDCRWRYRGCCDCDARILRTPSRSSDNSIWQQ